jgi:hypothetical protein
MGHGGGIVGKIQSGTDTYFHNDSFGRRQNLLSKLAYLFVSAGGVDQAGQDIPGIEAHRAFSAKRIANTAVEWDPLSRKWRLAAFATLVPEPRR